MASYAAESTGGLSQSAINQIATAVAQGLRTNNRTTAGGSPHEKRQQEYMSGIQKEAA